MNVMEVFFTYKIHIILCCLHADSSFVYSQANTNRDHIRHGHGGVIYSHDRTVLTAVRVTFVENITNFGGVHWVGQSANVSHKHVIFSSNLAHIDGGVFHVSDHSYLNIAAASFGSNRASNYGGVMHIDRSTTNIEDSKFNHNAAGNDGGVMRMHLSTAQTSSMIYTEIMLKMNEECTIPHKVESQSVVIHCLHTMRQGLVVFYGLTEDH